MTEGNDRPRIPEAGKLDWSGRSSGDEKGLSDAKPDREALRQPAVERRPLDPTAILERVDKGFGGKL